MVKRKYHFEKNPTKQAADTTTTWSCPFSEMCKEQKPFEEVVENQTEIIFLTMEVSVINLMFLPS